MSILKEAMCDDSHVPARAYQRAPFWFRRWTLGRLHVCISLATDEIQDCMSKITIYNRMNYFKQTMMDEPGSHMSYAVLTKQAVGRISLSQTKDTLQWIVISSPFTSDVPRQIVAPTTPPIDLFGLGIYYSLFFLTVVLIVTTLPKAIIAWKERG